MLKYLLSLLCEGCDNLLLPLQSPLPSKSWLTDQPREPRVSAISQIENSNGIKWWNLNTKKDKRFHRGIKISKANPNLRLYIVYKLGYYHSLEEKENF